MKHFLIGLIALIIINESAIAQHELFFLNGDKIRIDGYQISQDFSGDSIISYFYKNKTRELLLYDVFSIVDKNNVETIFYRKNEDFGFDLEVSEMRSYTTGAYEAKQNYNAIYATSVGFVSGVSAFFIPPFNQSIYIGNFNASLIPALPIISAGVVSLINPSDEKINLKYPNYSNDQYFKEGYRQSARNKRVRNSIIGGITGIITGLIITTSLN